MYQKQKIEYMDKKESKGEKWKKQEKMRRRKLYQYINLTLM